MSAKETIISIFRDKVKGKSPDVSGRNERHDGRYGHWLEEQFGIVANGNNEPDFLGYELKNETSSKTTFGDWSANVYVFTDDKYKEYFDGTRKWEKQNSFCRIFGKPNEEKGGRCSWSGSPCPKIGDFNAFGQKLVIKDNLDIVAIYSFSHDERPDKSEIVPEGLQLEDLELAKWYGEKLPDGVGGRHKCLKHKVEDKFNQLGWFTCKTDNQGRYEKICFGRPLNYYEWIDLVRKGTVFFDSGMYEGNKRPYSQWRANNTLWDSLINDGDIYE